MGELCPLAIPVGLHDPVCAVPLVRIMMKMKMKVMMMMMMMMMKMMAATPNCKCYLSIQVYKMYARLDPCSLAQVVEIQDAMCAVQFMMIMMMIWMMMRMMAATLNCTCVTCCTGVQDVRTTGPLFPGPGGGDPGPYPSLYQILWSRVWAQ